MRVLVLNSGSSSIKYQLFDMTDRSVLAGGLVERIGDDGARIVHKAGGDTTERSEPMPDHRAGFAQMAACLDASGLGEGAGSLGGIGHRVVHGGEAFSDPTLIDDDVVDAIRAQIPLAPLHNPANLIGIEVAREAFPDLPQVAVFDTAFHQTMPAHAYRYAVPESLYAERHVRRYGFHGTSHRYVARQAAEHLGRAPGEVNLIVLHLGNGASASAIENGRCVDTSMGLTPLEGLVMGTRSGDVDPALHAYLAREAGMDLDAVDALLNRESGLKGLCGDNDMRAVVTRMAAGDSAAALAFDVFCYRVKKYLGAYAAVLGRVDAVVFTAGIGEHAPAVRAAACAGLDPLGLVIDSERNEAGGGGIREIQADASTVKVLVVPTNEELEIAEQTVSRITGT